MIASPLYSDDMSVMRGLVQASGLLWFVRLCQFADGVWPLDSVVVDGCDDNLYMASQGMWTKLAALGVPRGCATPDAPLQCAARVLGLTLLRHLGLEHLVMFLAATYAHGQHLGEEVWAMVAAHDARLTGAAVSASQQLSEVLATFSGAPAVFLHRRTSGDWRHAWAHGDSPAATSYATDEDVRALEALSAATTLPHVSAHGKRSHFHRCSVGAASLLPVSVLCLGPLTGMVRPACHHCTAGLTAVLTLTLADGGEVVVLCAGMEALLRTYAAGTKVLRALRCIARMHRVPTLRRRCRRPILSLPDAGAGEECALCGDPRWLAGAVTRAHGVRTCLGRPVLLCDGCLSSTRR